MKRYKIRFSLRERAIFFTAWGAYRLVRRWWFINVYRFEPYSTYYSTAPNNLVILQRIA